jgi:hypothetical protein
MTLHIPERGGQHLDYNEAFSSTHRWIADWWK